MLKQFWSELVEVLEGVFHSFEFVVMEERLGHVECIVLEVVAGHTDLSANLLHSRLELTLGERYFVKPPGGLGGNWYMTSIFKGWCDERKLEPDWFNKE